MNPASPIIIALVIFVSGIGVFSSAPLAHLICGVIPLICVVLLWPRGALPLLLFPVVIQWLQIAAKPISAAIQGVPLSYLAERGGRLEFGFLLASLGLLSLVVGLRLGFGRPSRLLGANLREDLRRMKEADVYLITCSFLILGYVAELASNFSGGARQVVLAIADVKLSAIFLVVAWAVVCGRARIFAALVVIFEVGLGLTGFFAEYRGTLIVAVFAIISAAPKIQFRATVAASAVVLLTIALTIFWSAIKPEYRMFINRGTGQQVVDRTLPERLDYLFNAASSFSWAQASDGANRLVDRLGYIEFFSISLDAAAYSGNEGGEQTIGAIMHVLVPRLIYPDKPPLPNDTMVTSRYTGLQFQPGEESSISLGYYGELFADFGAIGLLIALVVIGGLIGKSCNILLTYPRGSLALNVSLAIMPLTNVMLFETALSKLVGGMLTSFIAALLLQRLLLPRFLGSRILSGKKSRLAKWPYR